MNKQTLPIDRQFEVMLEDMKEIEQTYHEMKQEMIEYLKENSSFGKDPCIKIYSPHWSYQESCFQVTFSCTHQFKNVTHNFLAHEKIEYTDYFKWKIEKRKNNNLGFSTVDEYDKQEEFFKLVQKGPNAIIKALTDEAKNKTLKTNMTLI